MTVQFPAFRLTVAERMEAYRERLAKRIDVELQRRGENHVDLAAALKISPRTAERWLSGEREPQRQHRKPLADYFDLQIEELWPDLELQEKNLRAQLDRIEEQVERLVRHLLPAEAPAEDREAPDHLPDAPGEDETGTSGADSQRRA